MFSNIRKFTVLNKIQNTEYRIQNTEYTIQDTEYRIQNKEYRIQNAVYRVKRITIINISFSKDVKISKKHGVNAV